MDLPAQMAERFEEKAFDVMRLEAPGFCPFHHFPDVGDLRGRQVVADERALGQQVE
jgi:hypothetical protein